MVLCATAVAALASVMVLCSPAGVLAQADDLDSASAWGSRRSGLL